MDQRITLCEHAGRLIEQTNKTELTTRQYLSQHNIRIPPFFNLPTDEAVNDKTSLDKKQYSLYVHALWTLLHQPLDIAAASLLPLKTEKISLRHGKRHVALDPTGSIAALATFQGKLSFYNYTSGKFLGCSTSFPDLITISDLTWHASTLAVAYAEGQIALLELDISNQQLSSKIFPILPLPVSVASCHSIAWLDVRFLAVATNRGLFLIDTTKRDLRRGHVRILKDACTHLAVSSSYIAVSSERGIRIFSYRYPMQVSATAKCSRIPATNLAFAQDRVLLYTIADTPEVKVLQLSNQEDNRAPLCRAFEKLAFSHLGQTGLTCLAISGNRVLVSTGKWTGLAQLNMTHGLAVWQDIGEVHGPLEVEGEKEVGKRAELLEVIPITHGRKQADGSLGFACLWSTMQVRILPIA